MPRRKPECHKYSKPWRRNPICRGCGKTVAYWNAHRAEACQHCGLAREREKCSTCGGFDPSPNGNSCPSCVPRYADTRPLSAQSPKSR